MSLDIEKILDKKKKIYTICIQYQFTCQKI